MAARSAPVLPISYENQMKIALLESEIAQLDGVNKPEDDKARAEIKDLEKEILKLEEKRDKSNSVIQKLNDAYNALISDRAYKGLLKLELEGTIAFEGLRKLASVDTHDSGSTVPKKGDRPTAEDTAQLSSLESSFGITDACNEVLFKRMQFEKTYFAPFQIKLEELESRRNKLLQEIKTRASAIASKRSEIEQLSKPIAKPAETVSGISEFDMLQDRLARQMRVAGDATSALEGFPIDQFDRFDQLARAASGLRGVAAPGRGRRFGNPLMAAMVRAAAERAAVGPRVHAPAKAAQAPIAGGDLRKTANESYLAQLTNLSDLKVSCESLCSKINEGKNLSHAELILLDLIINQAKLQDLPCKNTYKLPDETLTLIRETYHSHEVVVKSHLNAHSAAEGELFRTYLEPDVARASASEMEPIISRFEGGATCENLLSQKEMEMMFKMQGVSAGDLLRGMLAR